MVTNSTVYCVSVLSENPEYSPTPNCTKPEEGKEFVPFIPLIGLLVVAVSVIFLLLLCIIIAILVRKRNKKRKGRYNISEKWYNSNMTSEKERTIEYNGQRPRIQEKATRQFSEVQKELKQMSKAGPDRRYSANTPAEQSRKNFVVQKQPEHNSHSVDQSPPNMGALLQEDPLKTTKEVSGNNALSAESTHNTHTSPASEAHNIMSDKKDPDANVGLDQILIQLKEVAPQWRSLAEGVGLDHETLDRISEYATSESEAMVEVVDGWLAKLYPNKPTWREIADVVESIGHGSLADSIREVYTTGSLPKEVSKAVPNILTVRKESPPPLPPRLPDDDRDSPQQAPPPLPAKPIIY